MTSFFVTEHARMATALHLSRLASLQIIIAKTLLVMEKITTTALHLSKDSRAWQNSLIWNRQRPPRTVIFNSLRSMGLTSRDHVLKRKNDYSRGSYNYADVNYALSVLTKCVNVSTNSKANLMKPDANEKAHTDRWVHTKHVNLTLYLRSKSVI